MKRFKIVISFVLLLSILPLNFAQAAINTNLDIKVYQSTVTNLDYVTTRDGTVYFPFNSNSVKFIRHAKYKDYKFEQFEDSKATKASGSVTAFAAKCPGYYITRTYSDSQGKTQTGYIKYYIPKSVFTSNGIDISQCSQVTEPPTSAAPPAQTIHPTYPNPTATAPPVSENTTPAKVNPSFVMPPAPTPAQVVPEPTPAPPVAADICGNNNPVSTTKFNGMYPVGMIKESDGTVTNFYIPCDKSDNVLMYVQSTGTYHDAWACGTDYASISAASEFATLSSLVNQYGTLKGNSSGVEGVNVYYKSQNLPIYTPSASNGITTDEVKRTTGETICAVVYDSNEVTEDAAGNERFTCEAGQILVNNNQCQSEYEELETNIQSCGFLDTCISEFTPRFIDYEDPTSGSTNPETPIDPDNPPEEPEEPELPACFCEELAQWGGYEMGFTCCIFECPGLDAIISDFKNFLAFDLVGTATAPAVPQMPAPEMPNIFENMKQVDEKTPAPITTQEDPGLETSTFTADDVRGAASEIEFREDPTGGFNIVNPIETLDGNLSDPPQPEMKEESYPQINNSNNNNEKEVQKPSYNKTQVQQPSYSDNAQQPSLNGQVKYPSLD